jgi:hypothetical protein
MKKKVDAIQESEVEISEKKFFEMECQVLDLGISADSGKPVIALHYTYPFTDELISGLKSTDYIETFIHEQLKGDHKQFDSVISFNKTFGNENSLKVF